MRKTVSILVALLLSAGMLFGCSAPGATSKSAEGGNDVVRIGTMPTEDMLPLWVAEKAGLFASSDVNAEIISFDSAQGLSAAITAGEVDMAMTDVMRAIKLTESGSPVVMEWVTLGTEPEQGVFGVLAPADAPYDTLSEMAAYLAANPSQAQGVGVAANTVPEYVFDKLCEEAGLAADAIPTQEVASLPDRYGLVASGNLAGAALPGSLLVLGAANGLKLIADDATGQNLSQSVMVARESFAADHGQEIAAIAQVWDEAVALLQEDPTAYRPLLEEKANISGTIVEEYPLSAYPLATVDGSGLAHPAAELVEPQIAWMRAKGYSKADVSYDEGTGTVVIS